MNEIQNVLSNQLQPADQALTYFLQRNRNFTPNEDAENVYFIQFSADHHILVAVVMFIHKIGQRILHL